MKKQIRFLYRYITTSRRWRKWVNAQSLLVLFASLAFFTALAASGSSPAAREPAVKQPVSTVVKGSAATASGANVSRLIGQASSAKSAISAPVLGKKSQVRAAAPTATPMPTPTPTLLPDEYLYNGAQTIGITFAGSLLVLIVVIGVMAFMPKKG